MVFASIVSQLHLELREALISSGLDDPGLLRAYPWSSVEDLRAMGLGIPIAFSTSSSPSIPPSFPSSSIPQGQHTVPVISTTATLRPRGPERRRIMKKGGTLQTGVTDNSHVPLDGWAHIFSSSTVSPSFPLSLPVSSSHVSVSAQSFSVVSGRSSRDVSVGFSASSGLEGPSHSDPRDPLISANLAKSYTSLLKTNVREFRDFPGRTGGFTVEPEIRGNSSVSQLASSSTFSAQDEWSDEVILYFTLVADKVVPDGFLSDFLHLSRSISSAAHRQASRLAHVSDVEAALFVHGEQVKIKDQVLEHKAAVDIFVNASSFPPTRYKSRLHVAKFQGPSARKDAEESERQRWLQLLANLIVGTDTPMGKLLQSRQGDISLLGAGRRAGTLRSRVRNIRHI